MHIIVNPWKTKSLYQVKQNQTELQNYTATVNSKQEQLL